jgi:hypothetical protein
VREGLALLIDPLLGREPWNTWLRIAVSLWSAFVLSFALGIFALMMPGVANEIPPHWSFWGWVTSVCGTLTLVLMVPAGIASFVAAGLYTRGTPRTVRLKRASRSTRRDSRQLAIGRR